MSKNAVILLAEDEESDALLLQRAFQRAGISAGIFRVRDGQEAVEYLQGAPPYADRAAFPLPVLVLLDVKMPRLNGFDLLTWIRGQQPFQHLPCVMLSSSNNEVDREMARHLGASEYLVKPHAFEDLLNTVRGLNKRWLHAR